MTIIIFIVGLLVSSAVVYALFAYTIGEMGPYDKARNTNNRQIQRSIK
jgi:archaellum component FlaG (FlaF/FlaG flagellin family)